MVQQNCQEETTNSENPTQRRQPTVRSEDLSGELQGEQGETQPTETKDDAEAWEDFWSIQGDFICRHHFEPRVQLRVPKEETFTIPLNYIDVTRAAFSNMEVLQEKRIDDWWNVDGNRSSSDSWKGFTMLTTIERETSKGYMWHGERLDPNWEKPLRIEKNKNGNTRSQNSTMLDD